MPRNRFNFLHNSELESRRDAYGFALRPQHIQGYKAYAAIYKEEEVERSEKWKNFLEHQAKSPAEKYKEPLQAEATEFEEETVADRSSEGKKAEASELEKTFSSKKGSEGNAAEDTELKEEAVPVSASEVDAGEDTKLEREIVSERSCKSNKSDSSEGTKETVTERGRDREEAEATEFKEETLSDRDREGDDSSRTSDSDGSKELDAKKEQLSEDTKTHRIQTWAQIRPSLGTIEYMMSFRVKKRKVMNGEQITKSGDQLPSVYEASSSGGESDEDIKEKVCVTVTSYGSVNTSHEKGTLEDEISPEPFFPWKEELESLVQGGLPKDLRGELWQAFVGVKARRVERYYQDLLAQEINGGESKENENSSGVPRKWKKQIEKVNRCNALWTLSFNLFNLTYHGRSLAILL